MAFTAVAAVATAGTASTAVMVLAAVAEVGVALTVVGVVTGEESLIKLGSVMGLVGGIGGMIAGAGAAAGSTVAAEGSGAFLGEGVASGVPAWDGAAGMLDSSATGAMGESAAGASMNMGAAAGAEGGGGIISQAVPTAAPTATQASQAASAVTPDSLTVGAPTMPATTDPTAVMGAKAPATPATTDPTAVMGAKAPTTPIGQAAPKGFSDYFKGFGTFAKENQQLFSGGLQMVGGAMKGANDGAMWDQKIELETEALNVRKGQIANANSVGSFAPRGIVSGAR